MAFAQLTYRESLRAMCEKLYHMGIRAKVSRSTLADANEVRDWRIYTDFAKILIHEARRLYADDDFGLEWLPKKRLCSLSRWARHLCCTWNIFLTITRKR
jgi:hypothetical protein